MNIDVDQIKQLAVTYGLKIIISLVIFVIGLWIVGILTSWLKKTMEKRNVDPSLRGFLAGVFNAILKILLVVSVASTMGIETTSLAAVIGAAGLAIGLALQGSLANFAGGVLILIFKPFKVGDFIEGAGEAGTVEEIDILYTKMKTPQNVSIIVPNGPLANSNITNYSIKEVRRVDFPVGISYDADVKEARKIILGVLANDSRILSDPAAPIVVLTELADSSLNLSVRAWVKAPDYWDVFFEDLEAIKEALDAAGIGIPYPQMDVHLNKLD